MNTVELTSLGPLFDALRRAGYTVIGPTVRDDAIVLAELDSIDHLPYGWGVRLSPGGYRLRRRKGGSAFGRGRCGRRRLSRPRAESRRRALRR